MNWKHLIWIIPLCLLIGAYMFNFAFSWLLDFTMDAATEKAFEKLEDCHVAWIEKPLSNNRIIGADGQLCYKSDDMQIYCPQREHPMMDEYRSS